MTKNILILPGDGIGQEVTSAMREVLSYLIDEQGLDLNISERDVGGSSYDQFGVPLTEETLEIAKKHQNILKTLIADSPKVIDVDEWETNHFDTSTSWPYDKTFFSLVSETHFVWRCKFLSEKTFKAILKSVDNDSLELNIGKEELIVDFGIIDICKLIPNYKEILRGKNGR